ncbi:DUF5689 domain-containing protein [Prevotella sp. S7 MS 2]|uniref:DUF5689 domain-containing protein n=1 Tax=Prevotella sp. S7 MS 2 TaxID=1287488 RepID=UPI000513ECA7|nr:DUF5689 domain-containing protein [Prevotella sp. S7 MS 2]KGI60808.1 hypothetical protein HMPREF0671_03830 [Prevotella sp. S7 MS 2]
MKQILYFIVAVLTFMATGCMNNDWDNPDNKNAFGNEKIQESNVITIDKLKSQYADYIYQTTNTYTEITDDVQIKARVTGNDVGGNIYSEISVDDGTGALLICISQNGLFGFLPVGQEILIDLKGLYIGGYGQQAEIGIPYTNARGKSYVSRMSRYIWNEHFKLIGTADASKVTVEDFDGNKMKDANYLKSNSGKLMTIKGVKFNEGNGTDTYASTGTPDAANCVNRGLAGYNASNLVVRTSTYADFAASKLPTKTVDITGIFTRYGNTWQILVRTEADVK